MAGQEARVKNAKLAVKAMMLETSMPANGWVVVLKPFIWLSRRLARKKDVRSRDGDAPRALTVMSRSRISGLVNSSIDVCDVLSELFRNSASKSPDLEFLSSPQVSASEKWERVKRCTAAAMGEIPMRSKCRIESLLTAEQREIHKDWEQQCRCKGIRSDPNFQKMKRDYKNRRRRVAVKRYQN